MEMAGEERAHTSPTRKRGGEEVLFKRDDGLLATSSPPRLRVGLVFREPSRRELR